MCEELELGEEGEGQYNPLMPEFQPYRPVLADLAAQLQGRKK